MLLVNLNVRILALTSVPFRPTTKQMPNLALVETKRITAYTVIRFVSISAKFGICTVVGLKCDTLDISKNTQLVHLNANVKFSTN
jgi:hypothetical protein